MRILVEGKGKKLASQEGLIQLIRDLGVTCLIDGDGDENREFALLEDGVSYTLGPAVEEHKGTS